ncbi:DUF1014-domain-containing protein [Ramicandelaber brevisporus]|nr:DUF1014-domain-containing protein [Ramicandelaber brevisporus]
MSTFKNTTSAQAKDLVDRHPERRMKAAFAEYEARRLPELRAEHKSLRLSQVKDILWKEWQKSPENPMNQQQVAYNATQEELDAAVASINQAVQNQLRVRD